MNLAGLMLSTAPLAFAVVLTAVDAHGQAPRDCGGRSEAPAEAVRVVDGRSFLLLLLHREVYLFALSSGPDRYGRLVAYAFIRTSSGEALVQHELLAAGHALVSPGASAATCRIYLQNAERDARNGGLGLWGDPYHAVKAAADPADVLIEQGRFALVQGKVMSVRESGGIVYVNFGRRWSEQFTVTILKRNERIFAGAGLTPNALAGRSIEVRGWVEERGGPAIEVLRPEQIKVVH